MNVPGRMGFGAFLAPHHPIGEHPMLQLRRDLDFAEHLDRTLQTMHQDASESVWISGHIRTPVQWGIERW